MQCLQRESQALRSERATQCHGSWSRQVTLRSACATSIRSCRRSQDGCPQHSPMQQLQQGQQPRASWLQLVWESPLEAGQDLCSSLEPSHDRLPTPSLIESPPHSCRCGSAADAGRTAEACLHKQMCVAMKNRARVYIPMTRKPVAGLPIGHAFVHSGMPCTRNAACTGCTGWVQATGSSSLQHQG